jgi:hypothetical protein
MTVKITTVLGGAERLIREFKLLDPRVKARTVAAIQKNTKAVAAKTKAVAPVKTGEMASTIRDEYSENGLIGYVKVGFGKLPRRSKATTEKGKARFAKLKNRRKIGRGAYAPVIDRGDPRRHIKARHFLAQPFQDQKPTAIADINHALNDAIEDVLS